MSMGWTGKILFSEVGPVAKVRRGRDSRSDEGSPEGGAAWTFAAPPALLTTAGGFAAVRHASIAAFPPPSGLSQQ